MRYKFTGLATTALVCFGASGVYAGGMEVSRLPTDMMFENGNYASISFGRFSPNVTDNVYATSGSMYKDRSAITMTFSTQLNDKVTLGFANYKSAEISLDYANSAVAAVKPLNVDLNVKTMALLGRYEVAENVSVIGGLKYSTGSGGGNILVSPAGIITANKDSAVGAIIGASYENPEIALRISGFYQAKQDMKHVTTTTIDPTQTMQPTKSALPASYTLNFQSGIAPNTLLFGSIHRALWGDAHISFWSNAGTQGGTNGAGAGTGYVQKSTWTDSTSLSLGIGRKLSDEWAISSSLNYEGASEASGTSLLSTTDGVTGITLGGKYTQEGMTISGGINYSKLGDKKVDPAGALPEGTFSGNSVSTVGIKFGFNF